MIVSLIAAVTENNVIGRNNDLPWKLPDDMKYFMETTKGHAVIMGRKNFDSLPPKFKPLKDRFNIVLSRREEVGFDVCVVHSIEEAYQQAEKAGQDPEVFVIGGEQIFNLAMARADRLYITEIKTKLDGDTFFPAYNKSEWKEVSRKPHPTDDRHAYAFDFVLYERK
ncbi:MAG TPA: dihydrofolate reductase [Cyclobacteriaceae bacterium]|nr:dihydrofolate reductase [Cyclobacteriaceae bacterium]